MARRFSTPTVIKPLLCPPDPTFILKTGMGYIHCMNFSTDNSLYVGTENGEVSMWNLRSKQLCLKQIFKSPILTILLHNSTVITQEKEGLINVYRLEPDRLNILSSTSVTNMGFCKSIIIATILAVPKEESIDFYIIKTMTRSRSIVNKLKFGMLMCLIKVQIRFKIFFLAIYETGDGFLWDFLTFNIAGHVKFKPQPIAATFDKTNEKGAVVGASNLIQIFGIQNPRSGGISIIYQVEVQSDTLTAIESRPDGLVFVVGGSDGKLRYYSWKSLKLLVVLTEHSKAITDIQFIPKINVPFKTIMVASSADGNISFWDLY